MLAEKVFVALAVGVAVAAGTMVAMSVGEIQTSEGRTERSLIDPQPYPYPRPFTRLVR